MAESIKKIFIFYVVNECSLILKLSDRTTSASGCYDGIIFQPLSIDVLFDVMVKLQNWLTMP